MTRLHILHCKYIETWKLRFNSEQWNQSRFFPFIIYISLSHQTPPRLLAAPRRLEFRFFSVHFSFFVIFSFIFFWGGGDVLFLGLTLFCLRSGNCWNLLVGFFVVFFRLRFFFGLKNRDRVFSDDLFYRLSVAVARLCCLMRALTEFPTSLGTSVARVHLAIAKLGPNLIECECVCVCVSVCVCVCVFLLKSRRELNQELITCGMDSADGYWVFLFFSFLFHYGRPFPFGLLTTFFGFGERFFFTPKCRLHRLEGRVFVILDSWIDELASHPFP